MPAEPQPRRRVILWMQLGIFCCQIAFDFPGFIMTYRRSSKKIRRALLMSSELLGIATDDNFESEVLKSAKPVLVDFWAPWCGPCKAIGPIVEEIAGQFKDNIKVMKLNVDDNQKTAISYAVRSIPTLILFKEGKVLDTLVGLAPQKRLEDFVKKSF
jgi:thioredoxin 1